MNKELKEFMADLTDKNNFVRKTFLYSILPIYNRKYSGNILNNFKVQILKIKFIRRELGDHFV